MIHILRRLIVTIGLLAMAMLALAGTAEAAAPYGTNTWNVVSSPNASSNGNYLQAVAAFSGSNVWAVGYYYKGTSKSNMVKLTLIEHFDGSSWHIVASPNVGTGDNVLSGVAAISATNIYAVGGDLIEHFNGSTWSVVPHPSLCPLNAITALSATDIWVVGGAGDVQSKTCTAHFNGSSWSVVASPSPGTSDDKLTGVTEVSSSNVWAVGYYCVGAACDRGGGTFQTLVEHFNGSMWRVVASPNPSGVSSLNGIAAVSASNIYAVGSYLTSGSTSQTYGTLIEHFDGSSWSVVPSANVKGSDSLSAIAVVSGSNIYAVGAASIPTAPANPTLIERFNGSTWSIVSSPSPGFYNTLNGVARIPGTNHLWAVGNYNNNSPDLTLTERYC